VIENENIDESESSPLACEVPLTCVLITSARFASGFDLFFLSLILRQSAF